MLSTTEMRQLCAMMLIQELGLVVWPESHPFGPVTWKAGLATDWNGSVVTLVITGPWASAATPHAAVLERCGVELCPACDGEGGHETTQPSRGGFAEEGFELCAECDGGLVNTREGALKICVPFKDRPVEYRRYDKPFQFTGEPTPEGKEVLRQLAEANDPVKDAVAMARESVRRADELCEAASALHEARDNEAQDPGDEHKEAQ
jgi:hypothetical protein